MNKVMAEAVIYFLFWSIFMENVNRFKYTLENAIKFFEVYSKLVLQTYMKMINIIIFICVNV